MSNQTIHSRFLNEIKRLLPQKAKRTNILSEILSIEKEAIYRRLRGEVPFTFHEITLIANKFNISIDNIIGITSDKSRPSHFKMADFVEPYNIDYEMFEEYIEILATGQYEGSKIIEASNILPQSIFLKFDLITKFYYFKWNYHYNQSNQTFEQFDFTKRIKTIQNQTFIASKKIYYTTYIWDPLIIQYLISDIIFSKKMHLINETNVAAIKQELYCLVNYIEQTAQKGASLEANKKIDIYISSVSLDTSYTYLETPLHRVSLIKAFILTGIASLDEKTLEKTQIWVQSLKRTSTLISITGEKQRILFCNKQRKLIDQL